MKDVLPARSPESAYGLDELLDIMARLRDPETGCPWDIEQDFGTIAPYTIEEAYEVADAIEREDLADLKDELGDLLLQVVYHSQMARETGAFDFAQVFCDARQWVGHNSTDQPDRQSGRDDHDPDQDIDQVYQGCIDSRQEGRFRNDRSDAPPVKT